MTKINGLSARLKSCPCYKAFGMRAFSATSEVVPCYKALQRQLFSQPVKALPFQNSLEFIHSRILNNSQPA